MNEKKNVQFTRLLTIAGSDSGGGAGIQADLKTFSALGCFGMSVITALTAQNTQSVTDIHPVPVSFVEKQMDAVLDDIGVDAVKIGMLFSAKLITSVVSGLKKHRCQNIVLDPVMVAKSGDKLLQDDAIHALLHELAPLADVLTPNLLEAEVILGEKLTDSESVKEAAVRISSQTGSHVLLKGGHANGGDIVDILCRKDTNRIIEFPHPRIDTPNTHGTGCTLSSAIASYLGRGETVEKSVEKAVSFLQMAIRVGSNYKTGNGHGPVHHFYAYWE